MDPADTGEAKSALERARTLWDDGDQRGALDQVRKAAEAATLADQRDRALTLERALAALTRALDGGGSVASAVSGDKMRAVKPPGGGARAVAPARKSSVPKMPAVRKNSKPPGPKNSRPPGPKRRTSAPKMAAAKLAAAERVTAPAPAVARAAPPASSLALTAPAPAIAVSSPPGLADELELPAPEERDLVVTVAPSDWALPSPDALVGHSAVRVVIAPGRGPGGMIMVRPLSAGEVAPQGGSIALLVALEPGASALPRAKS